MNKLRERTIVVFSGIFFTIIIIELFLRTLGFLHLRTAIQNTLSAKQDDAHIILCIGDSYTEGMGASADKSYPRQLEDLLNKNFQGKNFRVVNNGKGGYNSAMILREFYRYLKENNPELIIILTGENNTWNSWGYGNYLEKRSFSSRSRDFLYTKKVFKLVKLLSRNIRQTLLNNRGKESKNGVADYYLQRGTEYFREFKYELSLYCLNKAIEIEPHNIKANITIALIYSIKNNISEASKWFRKVVELNPDFENVFSLYTGFCMNKGDAKLDKEITEILQKYSQSNPGSKDILKMVNNRQKYYRNLRQWLSLDLKEMISLCRKNKIKIILQNYPITICPNDILELCDVNLVLRDVARDNSLPFVDNFSKFKYLLANGAKVEEYFVVDKHCNINGYGIIAKNIFDKIIEEKLIDF